MPGLPRYLVPRPRGQSMPSPHRHQPLPQRQRHDARRGALAVAARGAHARAMPQVRDAGRAARAHGAGTGASNDGGDGDARRGRRCGATAAVRVCDGRGAGRVPGGRRTTAVCDAGYRGGTGADPGGPAGRGAAQRVGDPGTV